MLVLIDKPVSVSVEPAPIQIHRMLVLIHTITPRQINSPINSNTSNVSLNQRRKQLQEFIPFYSNTSNVSLNHCDICRRFIGDRNSNTSNVSLNL